MGHEVSSRAYPEIGVPDAHHPLSHHQGYKEKIAKCIKVNLFHMKMFAYFVEKLRATPDGDGSLLDHSVLLYGGGISDGNQHSHPNLPLLLIGGGSRPPKGRSHIRDPPNTPLRNPHPSVPDK